MAEYRVGRRAPFVTIPHQLLLQPRADAYTIAVYAALRAHADHTTGQGAFPSDETLSTWAGCSVRTVVDRRNRLRTMGWVEWESGRSNGSTNRYLVHDLLPAANGGGVQEAQRGYAGAAEGGMQELQTTENQGNENQGTRENESPGGDSPGEGAREECPAEWMHELWQEVLGTKGRTLRLTKGRRQKYLAMYQEHLEAAPDPRIAWRAVLYAVTRSDHHMSTRAYQMPESLLRNEERRDRWVEEAIKALAARGRTNGDEKAQRMRNDLRRHFEERRAQA